MIRKTQLWRRCHAAKIYLLPPGISKRVALLLLRSRVNYHELNVGKTGVPAAARKGPRHLRRARS
jgi:hypothetical protein